MAPATQTDNEWGVVSGLLDDFDLIVNEAWWATDPRFGEGKSPLLHLRGQATVDGAVVDEEAELLFGTGDGWKAGKGGENVTHPSGKTKFTDSSNAGKLVQAILELGPDVAAVLKEKGKPTEAETWRNTSWHFERKTFTFKNRKTGEMTEYQVALPTSFNGLTDSDAPAAKPTAATKKAASTAAAPSRKAKAEEAEEAPAAAAPSRKGKAAGGNSELRAYVIAFAKQFGPDEHGDFVDNVYDKDVMPADKLEEIQADEALGIEIMDETGKLWAEAHS